MIAMRGFVPEKQVITGKHYGDYYKESRAKSQRMVM